MEFTANRFYALALELGDGVSGAADFGGQDAEDPDGEGRVAEHQAVEVLAGDEAEFRACFGCRGEGIRLAPDQGRQAQQGPGIEGERHQVAAGGGLHGESGFALPEEVEALGICALGEQTGLFRTRNRGSALFECVNEFLLGNE